MGQQHHQWGAAELQLDRHLPLAGYHHPLFNRCPLLKLYDKCVDIDGWAQVLSEEHGCIEKLSFTRKLRPAAPIATPAQKKTSQREEASAR